MRKHLNNLNKLNNLNNFLEWLEDSYLGNIYYKLYFKLLDWKNNIKWGYQRAFRGYDDTAYWSLYSYITNIAQPVIEHMTKNLNGYPSNLEEKEWLEILNKINKAFLLLKKETFIYPETEEREIEEGLILFTKYFRNLWD